MSLFAAKKATDAKHTAKKDVKEVVIVDRDSGDHIRKKSKDRHSKKPLLKPQMTTIENDTPNEVHVLHTQNVTRWELKVTDVNGHVHEFKGEGVVELDLKSQTSKPLDKKVSQVLSSVGKSVSSTVEGFINSLDDFFSSDKK